MDDEPQSQEKASIPPPDLPKPSIPPPTLAPAPAPPSPPPVVQVNIRDASDGDGVPGAGATAPFNSRVIAAIIDIVVSIGLQISAIWILPGFAHRIAWLVGFAYLATRDSLPFLGGQSVGKKAMKLRAVTKEGKPLTGNWEPSLIRNAVLLIPFFPIIELFVLLNREDKPGRGLRLGDEWAKTKVIVAEEPPAAAE